jgi:DNA-binding NtrC family response regulator
MDDARPSEGRHVVAPSAPSRDLSLLVMSRDGVVVFPLPAKGDVTLGRSPDCDVHIDDAKASRVHAVLRVGAHVTVEDNGSRNGTLVAERRLAPREPVELGLGAMITIGATVLVLQSTSPHGKPKRVWSQGAFEARVEEERAVTRARGTAFGLVRIQVETSAPRHTVSTLDSTDVAQSTRSVERIGAILDEFLRPADVVATLAHGVLEILLPATEAGQAKAIATQLRERLLDSGVTADVGLAMYPEDGGSRESLEAYAKKHVHAREHEEEETPKSVQFDDDAMARLEPLVSRIASSTISLLILGETGVGKEVMARSVHAQSPRARGPMVTFNCAAFSESLLESELFGYEKGAFTGAVQAKAGLLESAEGGTVFLDEVGEMPLSLQAKLLRVIEQREVRRIGSLKPRPIDVRFIAATNRDLELEVRERRFREDLYFRLNGVSIVIPALRERVGVIEPLARAFVAQASALAQRPAPAIAPAVVALLRRYRWPGNIRELKNVMDRATLLCSGSTITLEHVSSEKVGSVIAPWARAAEERPHEPSRHMTTVPPESLTPAEVGFDSAAISERQRIEATLAQCGGNQTRAAVLLGISRRTLVSRLGEYGLPRPRK